MPDALPPLRPLLFVSGGMEYGGMEQQMLRLAERHAAAGGRVRFAVGPGPLHARAQALGSAEIVAWDHDRLIENAARIGGLLELGTVAVLPVDPRTIFILPHLAVRGLVHLCAHNRPGTFTKWLHPLAVLKLRALVPALYAEGRLLLTVASAEHAAPHAQWFGLPPDSTHALAPAAAWANTDTPVRAGPISRIGVVIRLSAEKLPFIDAALALIDAAHRAGHDPTLDIWGSGPEEAEVAARCARHLPPERWRLHGATAVPERSILDVDLAVNAGAGIAEALTAGRRAVSVAPLRPQNPLGRLITPASFASMKADNFAAAAPPITADEVWRDALAMSETELLELRDRARAELSPAVMHRRHAELIAAMSPPLRMGPIAEALVIRDLVTESEFWRLSAVSDRLWRQLHAPMSESA